MILLLLTKNIDDHIVPFLRVDLCEKAFVGNQCSVPYDKIPSKTCIFAILVFFFMALKGLVQLFFI